MKDPVELLLHCSLLPYAPEVYRESGVGYEPTLLPEMAARYSFRLADHRLLEI